MPLARRPVEEKVKAMTEIVSIALEEVVPSDWKVSRIGLLGPRKTMRKMRKMMMRKRKRKGKGECGDNQQGSHQKIGVRKRNG
jgi:hypothetical protein